jgi:hypothetical protein
MQQATTSVSQAGIFEYWHSETSKYPGLARMWRQLHACPASEEGIAAAGTQHDDLKKHTMDKTLESTLKADMNTKLPTFDAYQTAYF